MIIMSKQSTKRELFDTGDYSLLGYLFLIITVIILIFVPWVFNWLTKITTPIPWIFPIVTILIVVFGWFRNKGFSGIMSWGILTFLLFLAIYQANLINNVLEVIHSWFGV